MKLSCLRAEVRRQKEEGRRQKEEVGHSGNTRTAQRWRLFANDFQKRKFAGSLSRQTLRWVQRASRRLPDLRLCPLDRRSSLPALRARLILGFAPVADRFEKPHLAGAGAPGRRGVSVFLPLGAGDCARRMTGCLSPRVGDLWPSFFAANSP